VKRTIALPLLLAALLLAGGAVLAEDIVCPGTCAGSEQADVIVGQNEDKQIAGRGGNDTIFGDLTVDGGNDLLRGAGGDEINDSFTSTDTDTVFGGKGNDTIDVRDGSEGKDVVDCGPGKDTVFFDPGVDRIKNCEVKNPF
jgi:Ca2+-binding RTX toxin-like protein